MNFLRFIYFLFLDIKKEAKEHKIPTNVMLDQIYFTGVQALPIIGIISLLLGAIIIKEGHAYVGKFVDQSWIYKIIVSIMIRDAAPFITALIVLSRSGIAMATELGYMSINKEVDSLRIMGISPLTYIVMPRIIGVSISIILLVIYFLLIGIIGGYIVTNIFSPIPFWVFMGKLSQNMDIFDLSIMFGKAFLSGFFISLICCFHGLNARHSFTEIPQRNIKAFAQSAFGILGINFTGIAFYLVIAT